MRELKRDRRGAVVPEAAERSPRSGLASQDFLAFQVSDIDAVGLQLRVSSTSVTSRAPTAGSRGSSTRRGLVGLCCSSWRSWRTPACDGEGRRGPGISLTTAVRDPRRRVEDLDARLWRSFVERLAQTARADLRRRRLPISNATSPGVEADPATT